MATMNEPLCYPRAAGFTLIELMLVVAIVGVLASIAAPSLRQIILTQYVRSGASDLQSALYFARSEAIKRAACVSVVPASSAWQNGWTVTLTSTPTACDSTGTVLRSQNPLSDQLSAMSGATVTYRSDGRVTALPSIVAFKTASASVPARCVVVDLSGRPSVVYAPDSGCS